MAMKNAYLGARFGHKGLNINFLLHFGWLLGIAGCRP